MIDYVEGATCKSFYHSLDLPLADKKTTFGPTIKGKAG